MESNKNKKETKRERFLRVAESRTRKIIKMIRLLGNCANRSAYEYNEEDVKKIFNAIEREIKTAKSKFEEAVYKEEEFILK
ncbi:MAG: hypothetical protein PWP66_277 [Thermosediminibacterales bacterium]|nr:hypothetical protein [Thermosediminibacterales bacterium]